MDILSTKFKSIQVFKFKLRNDSVASLDTIQTSRSGRRQSRLSEIFGLNGAAPVINGDLEPIVEQDPLPTTEEMEELMKLSVLDRNRNKTPFVDLVRPNLKKRNIVIFIRHFFCPNCFGYVKALANELPPEKLEQMDPPTTVTIIGCGDPILIPNYMKMTDCPYEIYADPSRSTYTALGLSVNEIATEGVPKYVQRYSTTSVFKAILIGLGLAVRAKNTAAGNKSQNGGELIWVDGKLQFIHRMRHTNDHLEVDQLDYVLRK
ncbi:hypothetical protein MBLNU459_g4202t3 [Dothideomycetes sp. NU459]